MPSPFDKLTGPGKVLKAEPPDRREFAGLKRSGHVYRARSRLNSSAQTDSAQKLHHYDPLLSR